MNWPSASPGSRTRRSCDWRMVIAGLVLLAVGLFFTVFLLAYSDLSLAALQSPRSGNVMNLAEGLFRAEQTYPGPETEQIVRFIQSGRRGVISFS